MKQQVKFNMYCKLYKTVLCGFWLIFFVNQHAIAMWGDLFGADVFDAKTAARYVKQKKFSALQAYLDSYSRDIKALGFMMEAFKGGSGLALYSVLRSVSVNPVIGNNFVCTGRIDDQLRYDQRVVQLLMIVLYQSILFAYVNKSPFFPARVFNLFKKKVSCWLGNHLKNKVGYFEVSEYIDEIMQWFDSPCCEENQWNDKKFHENRTLLLENCLWVAYCDYKCKTEELLILNKPYVDISNFIERMAFLSANYSSIRSTILSEIEDVIKNKMQPRTLRDLVKKELPLCWVRNLLKKLPKRPNIHSFVLLKRSGLKDYKRSEVVIDGSQASDEEKISERSIGDLSDVSASVFYFTHENHGGEVFPSSTGQIVKDLCSMSGNLYALTDIKKSVWKFRQSCTKELKNAQPVHLFFLIRLIKTHRKKVYIKNNKKFAELVRYVMLFIYRVALDCIMTYALTNNELVLKNFKDVFCKKIWDDYFSYSLGMRDKLILAPYRKIRGSVVAEIIKLHATVCSGELQERKLFPACIWVSNVNWAASWGRGSWVLKFSNPESITQDHYQIACQKYHREILRGKVIEYLNKIFSKYKTFTELFESADPLDTQRLKNSVITWRQEATLS